MTVCAQTGRFLLGHHWRSRAPHWERDFLLAAYVEEGRSAADIAAQAGCKEANILYWMRKHGITRRTVSQVRARKHWGVSGPANPMYGKRGALCRHYINGSSPERQRIYSRAEWRSFVASIYKRDGYRCRRCETPRTPTIRFHAHHVKSWARHPELRMEETNVVTLCAPCHRWVHSKKNERKEFLA